jgi:hypothetical protein
MASTPKKGKASKKAPEEPEESAYEQLEERSEQLQKDREKGGPGAAQPPEAARPLLHPKYSEPK